MTQAPGIGIGIVGKEGHRTSLTRDLSIEKFCHLTMLMRHGRNSYKAHAIEYAKASC
ncbi:hypothetical protein B9Z19DRAFT_1073936, partial [Tuber borchii]